MKHNRSCSRSIKVAAEIKRVVSEYLIRGGVESYEEINPLMIVVTGVDVSSCLQHAKVFISSIDGKPGDNYVNFLEAHSSQIRKAIGDNVKLKFVPEIRFIIDTSFERARRIEEILKGL